MLVGVALVFAAVELGTGWIEPYGLFHDELYYWANSQRLGLGYVDHPPLAPWVLAATQAMLGDGLVGFGLVPALSGAGVVLLTGLMARRMGAGRYGQVLAALCAAVAPFYLGIFSFYSVNAFEVLFWTATCFGMLELIRTGDGRWWLAIGLATGLALLNKHTFVLLGFALAVGMLATPLRRQLGSRWLWLGGALALVVALPNLYWNAVNDWPSLAFYRSVGAEKNIPTPLGEALLLQVVGMNPAALLVWLPGLAWLLFARDARPYRPLGIAFLTLFAMILFSGLRRGDRIVGAYPIVLAAGATFWDSRHGRGETAVRWALPVFLAAFGVLLSPAALPVLPPPQVEKFFEAIGEKPHLEASDIGHRLPVTLLGRLEWERVAEDVIAAYESLPAEQQARAVILAPHWVWASVVEYYGRDRGLPPVASPHNAYYFWRSEAAGRDVVLSLHVQSEVLSRDFAETRVVRTFRCEHCANWRPDMPIAVSAGPSKPIEELLADWRHFGGGAVPKLRP